MHRAAKNLPGGCPCSGQGFAPCPSCTGALWAGPEVICGPRGWFCLLQVAAAAAQGLGTCDLLGMVAAWGHGGLGRRNGDGASLVALWSWSGERVMLWERIPTSSWLGGGKRNKTHQKKCRIQCPWSLLQRDDGGDSSGVAAVPWEEPALWMATCREAFSEQLLQEERS